MTVGTRSVLYGAHCFVLHPWFVAWAWWQLYGFPWDPRLWVAFVVHDLGYIGKPNMDGEEGEQHPVLGARVMGALFDRRGSTRWHDFTLLHSRYFAKRRGVPFSRLCVADKLAISLTPAWLYLPLVRATGEVREYMAHAIHRAASNEKLSPDERRRVTSGDQRAWYAGVQDYCRRWALEHRDGRADVWTNTNAKRAAIGADGVWR